MTDELYIDSGVGGGEMSIKGSIGTMSKPCLPPFLLPLAWNAGPAFGTRQVLPSD